MMPIHKRVVEPDPQALCARSIHKLSDQIATCSLPRSAVVGEFRVEVAEAFMVLGRHHHILLSGLLGQPSPIARGVWFGIEVLGKLFVLRYGHAFHFHRPLMPPDHAVKSPVDEHSELSCMPPLHPAFVLRRRSGLSYRLARVIFLRAHQGRPRSQSSARRQQFQVIPSRCFHNDFGSLPVACCMEFVRLLTEKGILLRHVKRTSNYAQGNGSPRTRNTAEYDVRRSAIGCMVQYLTYATRCKPKHRSGACSVEGECCPAPAGGDSRGKDCSRGKNC